MRTHQKKNAGNLMGIARTILQERYVNTLSEICSNKVRQNARKILQGRNVNTLSEIRSNNVKRDCRSIFPEQNIHTLNELQLQGKTLLLLLRAAPACRL
jgi:hypothetical protein